MSSSVTRIAYQPLRMRLARPDDARVIGQLIRRVLKRCVVPTQPRRGARDLLIHSSAHAMRRKILHGQRFHLAFRGNVLVGISAMRGDTYLTHLFVSTRYQGQGIGRRLWERTMRDAMRRAGTRRFSLHATHDAVPMYLRLGFRATGRETTSQAGIIATPMTLLLPAAPHQGA